jgi:hypothetical protein
MYSSMLNGNSSTYTRTGCGMENYYYEAIQVNIANSGYYTLSSKSNINTYGYLYTNSFIPNDPFMNLFLQNIYGCGINQFKLDTFLQFNTDYILVVTTSTPNVTGPFSILVSGPNNATLKRISESI